MNEISRLVELSAEIVAAHLSRHDVPSFEISPLIRKVHATLVSLQVEDAAGEIAPAVLSNKSEPLSLEKQPSIYEPQEEAPELQPAPEIADADIYGLPSSPEALPKVDAPEDTALSPEDDRRGGYVRNGVQSLYEDHLVCLEDGKSVVLMTRHLKGRYGMTPEQYRQKWNLPADYPMTAPNYSAFKRETALQSGLGKGSKGRPSKTIVEAPFQEPSIAAQADVKHPESLGTKTIAATKVRPGKKSFLKEALDIFSTPEPVISPVRKENRPRKPGKLSPVYEG